MALNRLKTEEMVQLSAPWVTKGTPARKALGAITELSGLLGRVDTAHAALHETQAPAADPRLAALAAEATSVDLAHDDAIRGVHMLLSGLAILAGPGAEAESLVRLRELLLPDGLAATQRAYRVESGAAELLASRLAADPAARKRLKAIPVLAHTALHHVDAWLASAKRLGEIEDERASLAAAPATGGGAKQVAARNQWIRATNALIANAELAELDEETDRLLFGALRVAEKAAERRNRGGADASGGAADPAVPPAAAASAVGAVGAASAASATKSA